MTKKHFIELADVIRRAKGTETEFSMAQMGQLAGFCHNQNPQFNATRWIDYIEGKCWPSGGTVKKEAR